MQAMLNLGQRIHAIHGKPLPNQPVMHLYDVTGKIFAIEGFAIRVAYRQYEGCRLNCSRLSIPPGYQNTEPRLGSEYLIRSK